EGSQPLPVVDPGFAALVKYDAARQALAEAHRVDEVLTIKNKERAMQAYARQAHDRELELWVAEIRLRAKRRAGELLAEMKETGERAGRGGDHTGNVTRDDIATLPELGVTRNESSKWQKLAAIPEADFDATIADAMDNHVTTTTAEVLRACVLRDQWK